MNDMELVTDVPVLDMEMEVVTRNYPVIPNPEGEPTEDISTMEIDNVIYAVKDETARTELGNKVDKVEGKGLSENDYTDEDKAIVDGVTEALNGKVDKDGDKVLSDNNYSDEDKAIVDGVTSALNDKADKSDTYTKSEVDSALDNKVDKAEGKGLSENDFTDTLKDKLDGIEEQANKTIVDNSVTATSTNPVESKAIYNLLNDLLPEAEETGNPISISNASGFNAKALTVDMLPIQDLHGYDKPWAGGSGKNKFDDSSLTIGKTINSDGAISNQNDRCATVNGILITSNATYTISYTGTMRNGVFFYGENGTFISFLSWGDNQRTFTTPNNAVLVRFSFDSGTKPTNVQLELGETATSYEPYSNICPISGRTQTEIEVNGETTTISFGETVYGGTCDVVNGGTKEDWYYRKDKISDYSAGTSVGDFTRKNLLCKNGTATDKNIPAVCDKLPYLLSYSGNQLHFYVDNEAGEKARIYIFVPNDIDTNTEVEVAFKLQTPSSTISTPSNEISLNKGNNTLSTSGDNMDLKYSTTISNPTSLTMARPTLSLSSPIVEEPTEETDER